MAAAFPCRGPAVAANKRPRWSVSYSPEDKTAEHRALDWRRQKKGDFQERAFFTVALTPEHRLAAGGGGQWMGLCVCVCVCVCVLHRGRGGERCSREPTPQ